MQKMKGVVNSHQDYCGLIRVHDDYFTVKHYGGDVSIPEKIP